MKPMRTLAALAVLTVVAACTADEEPTTPTATPSAVASASPTTRDGEAIDFAVIPEIVDAVQPSVVSILRPDGGEGSGVIWSSDGIIVTNEHVVRGTRAVVVAFADGQRVEGEVLAADRRTDLAVVRAAREDLPPATFADELPEIGALALAIGNPIGFENSVTQGIVSGLQRSIPGTAQISPALVDLIQTDAAISPGNSGGALVGADGEVMGINVAYIPPQTAGAVALGFAIPAGTVTNVVEQLLEDGTAEHPYLGVRLAPLTAQLRQQLDVGAERGVVVIGLEEGGPADEAGLEPGDVITAVDGEPVATVEEHLAALRGRAPGDSLPLTVLRDGEEREISVTLGQLPPVG